LKKIKNIKIFKKSNRDKKPKEDDFEEKRFTNIKGFA